MVLLNSQILPTLLLGIIVPTPICNLLGFNLRLDDYVSVLQHTSGLVPLHHHLRKPFAGSDAHTLRNRSEFVDDRLWLWLDAILKGSGDFDSADVVLEVIGGGAFGDPDSFNLLAAFLRGGIYIIFDFIPVDVDEMLCL